MDTLQLLQKIYSITSEGKCSQLPESVWIDVIQCVTTELSYRNYLYTPSEQNTLQNHLSYLKKTLMESANIDSSYHICLCLKELIGIVSSLPSVSFCDALMENASFDHAALGHYQKNTTLILGDSHVNFFSGNEDITYIPLGHGINLCPQVNDYPFTALHLGPCLAYTCCSESSSTALHSKIDYLKEHFIRPSSRLILSLGEIDLRVHVYKQSQLQSRSYTEIIDDILNKYSALLEQLVESGYIVYCWGPIATQSDSAPLDQSFPRVSTEQNRNIATAYFNTQLKTTCERLGCHFLSIFDQLVDDHFHTLTEYYSSDQVHLGQSAMRLAEPLFTKAGILRSVI